MKKRLLYIGTFIFLILCVTSLKAATISVANGSDNAEIYINNRFVSRKSLENYIVSEGSYHIKVYENNSKIFSTVLDIKETDNKYIDLQESPSSPQIHHNIPSNSALSVFTDDRNSMIYIDGKQVGVGTISNYIVTKGSHNVMVYQGNLKVFSKVVEVPENEVVAVDTTHFVDFTSDVPNIGAKLQEIKRMKASRGNLGLGFSLGYTSGVNLRYYFTDKFGIQGTYIGAKTNSSDASNNWDAKAIFVLKDNIINGKLASLYFTTGFGGKNKTSDTQETRIDTFEANLGVEIPITKGFLAADNAYFTLELGYLRSNGYKREDGYNYWNGYQYYQNETDIDYSGFGMRAGVSYFF